VAFWLTYQELLLGGIRSIEDELGAVDAVTASEVRRVANSVLRSPIQLAVIGPYSRESVFRAAIES
jgi:predicted Zn-dependent peptidase